MWETWLGQTRPVVPVIVINNLEDAVPMAQALVNGGIHLLEVTLRTGCAYDAIREISQNVPDAIVGVGTVTRPAELHTAVNNGAQFVISPGFTPSLLDAAKEWGGPYLPGVATPGEVMLAREAGFNRMKFFPAEAAGGIDMLKSIGAPLPDVSFCPTGGINARTSHDYLALSNVFAVGGSWLTPANLIQNKDWAGITHIAETS
ncbi:MAG: keto-deoxy-phosphogluconate aldolase [Oceanospirillaceae bacterium]|nr:keto-deoxy-phosphogluconate aldolase [Oceanospirillaceae bacterium]|tara:strand:+ start:533 stop:1141 length:609 start_codon:yes stop_codon:yes gene_type:complete